MNGAPDSFVAAVWAYYRVHGRHDLPWRRPEPDGTFDPYKILVSEVMLQQTQVPRVIPKYEAFLRRFPTLQAIAEAPLGDVLVAWQGLGYNRRAKYLWQAARMVADERSGVLPRSVEELSELPGIGRNTAAAILAYAFDERVVFVETNIRTVFIHHFFKDQTGVPDKAILEFAAQTLDRDNPREWYWALMDYGSYLKQSVGNLSRSSKAYARQAKFAGSERQLRGRVLRLLAPAPQSKTELLAALGDQRAPGILAQLEREGLVTRTGSQYRLP